MPSSSTILLDCDGIEARFHSILGRFFVTFAKVELNLSLRVGGDGHFSDKLDRLCRLSFELNDSDDRDDRFCEILSLYMAADSLREVRNRLAHGRWGFRVPSQQIIHVSGYPSGPQDERVYTIGELEAIVRDAESLCNELGQLPKDLVCLPPTIG